MLQAIGCEREEGFDLTGWRRAIEGRQAQNVFARNRRRRQVERVERKVCRSAASEDFREMECTERWYRDER